MHDTNDRPTLMPAKRESATQSAARLRRTLHRRWPTVPFSVRLAPGDEITVTWSDGPPAADVARAAHGHARLCADERHDEATLWVSPRGLLSLVLPGAERVTLQRASGRTIEHRAA